MSEIQRSVSKPSRLKGVPITGFDASAHTGQVFYVNSATGSADNDGLAMDRAMATWNQAVDKTTTNNGDAVVLMENHAENIAAAAGVDFDTAAGVKNIGLGAGASRPTITFITAAGADVDVDINDIEISNIVFVCNITNQDTMLDVSANGDGLYVHDCQFNETGAVGLANITIAGAADDVVIENNEFYSVGANGDHAIAIDAVVDRLQIKGNFIFGDYDNAAVHSGSAHLQCRIENNTIINTATGQHAIEFSAAATGVINNNFLGGDTSTIALDPGSCYVGTNPWNTTGDTVSGRGALPEATFSNQLGTRVVATSGDVTAAADDIFTVTGKNLVTLVHGEVTTAVAGGTTPDVKLNMKSASYDMCAFTVVTADGAGTLYMLSGDQDDVSNQGDVSTVDIVQLGDADAWMPMIVDGDVIEMTTQGTATAGVLIWELFYIPLEAGASIVAAA